MYESFRIENFRCFEQLELNNLARINLIGGKNNVGKTSLLEAILLHGGGTLVGLAVTIQSLRGLDPSAFGHTNSSDVPWLSIFRNLNMAEDIHLTGKFNGQEQLLQISTTPINLVNELQTYREQNGDRNIATTTDGSMTLRFTPTIGNKTQNYHMIADRQGLQFDPNSPPINNVAMLGARVRIPANDDATRLGTLLKAKADKPILETLRIIDPRLNSLTTLPANELGALIYGDIGEDNLLPLPVMGDGIVRLATIVIVMATLAKNGVLLIDEIENGLHYTVQTKIWKAIADAAEEFNVQIFATTHSLEMVRAAHEAFSEQDDYDFRYHRLDRHPDTNQIEVVTYNQESMKAAISMGAEVR